MKKIRKSKFNLLDVIIIVIMLSLMVAAYLKTNHREISMMNIKETKGTLVLNVETQTTTGELNNLIGSVLYLSDNNQRIGIVENVSLIQTSSDDNKSVLNEIGMFSEKYIYKITVRDITVKHSPERGYYLNSSYYIARGKTINIKTQNEVSYPATIDFIAAEN